MHVLQNGYVCFCFNRMACHLPGAFAHRHVAFWKYLSWALKNNSRFSLKGDSYDFVILVVFSCDLLVVYSRDFMMIPRTKYCLIPLTTNVLSHEVAAWAVYFLEKSNPNPISETLFPRSETLLLHSERRFPWTDIMLLRSERRFSWADVQFLWTDAVLPRSEVKFPRTDVLFLRTHIKFP